jgi:transposase
MQTASPVVPTRAAVDDLGQGQGRAIGPGRRALDSGEIAQSAVLQRRRSERRDRRTGRRHQRPRHEGYDASRVELFPAIDKPALKPLPGEPYAFAVWKRCRVAPDYHIEIDGHWYSAPFRLIKELVDARIADKTVEIFHKGQRVASHLRAPNRRGHTTIAEHMPSAHRRHAAWTPARIVAYAEKIGPSTAALCEAIMAARPHPEQGFRTCLGILALTRTYGAARVDAACRRGVSIKARSVTSLRSILQNGLDRTFLDDGEQGEREPVRHGNIRGRDYFH